MAWKKRTEAQCLPAGEYDAEILGAEQATSKKGRAMVVLTIGIDFQGHRTIKDWIVQGWHKPKIAAIAAALGLSDALAAGTFRLSEQIRKPIRVAVTLENDPSYGWQNRLGAYMATGLGMGPDVPGFDFQRWEPEAYPDMEKAPF